MFNIKIKIFVKPEKVTESRELGLSLTLSLSLLLSPSVSQTHTTHNQICGGTIFYAGNQRQAAIEINFIY